MKNAIYYYYNLVPDDIHQINKMYYFYYNNIRYSLVLYEGDLAALNDIYMLHANLISKGIYVHQIILNRDNSIVTLIGGNPYILLKTLHYDKKIHYENVLSFSNLFVDQNVSINNTFFSNSIVGNKKSQNKFTTSTINWADLWSTKNDYLEYQISQLGQKHLNLRNSFSYYIGLGETSIQLVNTIPLDNIPNVISHRRINNDDTFFELYNPLNMIVDSRVRDMAEYFKNCFFNGKNIVNELNHFLTHTNLNETEHLLFLARMIYPTYYFDLFEDVISEKVDDKQIKKITDLSGDYEILLKYLYNYYKSIFKIQPIEWLERY